MTSRALDSRKLLAAGLLAAVGIGAALAAAGVQAQSVSYSDDGKVVGISARNPGTAIAADRRAGATSRLPMLSSRSQIPGYPVFSTQAYGSESHPFTTKAAYSSAAQPAPVTLAPWRATGKLYMDFGGEISTCTASVIDKGVLVTAAHCVWQFGDALTGAADALTFQPALHDATARYGTWAALQWYVSSAYADGTDTCTLAGVVCENDVAVVVLDTGTGTQTGKYIAEVVGRYTYYKNNQGYRSFLGKSATQITQLGYPAAFDNGLRMIRTDSMGYQEAPNNVLIGSDQTGGSSGGPWIMNFGTAPGSVSTEPSFNVSNKVVATTSWGFTDATLKVQGASRFGNNTVYPAPGLSNIASLLASACQDHPAHCY